LDNLIEYHQKAGIKSVFKVFECIYKSPIKRTFSQQVLASGSMKNTPKRGPSAKKIAV
jgi:hypothetical protein